MGVYIKGMEMPKGCHGCPFNMWVCTAKVAVFGKEPLHEPGEWWCPLVEVPSHGDLIDRDEMMKKHSSWFYEGDEVCESIKAAPVVIPAERSKQ